MRDVACIAHAEEHSGCLSLSRNQPPLELCRICRREGYLFVAKANSRRSRHMQRFGEINKVLFKSVLKRHGKNQGSYQVEQEPVTKFTEEGCSLCRSHWSIIYARNSGRPEPAR